MKRLNLILLIALAFFYSLSEISAQSRNSNAGSPSIQNQSEKLRSATGWKLDAEGNWISNQNAISDSKLNELTQYTVPQNFLWLQFISLKNGTQDLYALLYETTVHASANKSERRVYYFLMTAKSYASIVSTVKAKNSETLTIHSSSYGYMSDNDGIYSASKLLQLMNKSIADKNIMEYDFNINAQYIDNEEVVRFLLPTKPSGVNNALTNSYFETKWSEFNMILLPTSTNTIHQEFDLGVAPPAVSAAANAVQQERNDDMEGRDNSQQVGISSDKPLLTTVDTTIMQGSFDQPDYGGLDERINKERAIVSAPIATFSGIEGWYMNDEGNWVTDKSYSYQFETVGRYEMRNLKYRDVDYILIIRKEKYAGETFYLIAKDNYIDALANLDKLSIIRFPLVAYADLSYTLDEMVKISEEAIDTPKRKDAIILKNNYLVLQYKLSELKNVARFFIFYQECSKYGSETSKESCNAKVSRKIKYGDESLLGSDVLFNKMYYESSYDKFLNFFQKIAPSSNTQKNNNDFDFSR